jgi:hypothetical protein
MKILLFLPLLLGLVVVQSPSTSSPSSVEVVSHKWSPTRHILENLDSGGNPAPASAMISQNKNFARNARTNDPAGVRDPNSDSVDGRAAAIEKSVQESRSPKSKTVDGFAYHIKVRNLGKANVEILFWEYQFIDPLNPSTLTRHQFLCGVDVHAGKEHELEGFSTTAPSAVVNAGSLGMENKTSIEEKVVINRVEYSDGTIWQRPDWSLREVKTSYERALAGPWTPGMCKGL